MKQHVPLHTLYAAEIDILIETRRTHPADVVFNPPLSERLAKAREDIKAHPDHRSGAQRAYLLSRQAILPVRDEQECNACIFLTSNFAYERQEGRLSQHPGLETYADEELSITSPDRCLKNRAEFPNGLLCQEYLPCFSTTEMNTLERQTIEQKLRELKDER